MVYDTWVVHAAVLSVDSDVAARVKRCCHGNTFSYADLSFFSF
jgi:hypothetical protein